MVGLNSLSRSGVLVAVNIFFVTAMAQNKCIDVFKDNSNIMSIVDRTVETYQLKPDERAKLIDALLKNAELAEMLKDPNFVNYMKGVAEGKTIEELRVSLYKLWESAVDSESDVKLKAYLDAAFKFELDKLFPSGKPLSRVEKLKFNFDKFLTQLKGLPFTIKRTKSLIQQEINPKFLDSRLWHFYGYLNLRLEESRQADWPKTQGGGFGDIKLTDAVNIDPTLLMKITKLASETEQPIDSYSDVSGEFLRIISPQASRFMGKTIEEAEALRKNKKGSWCTNSWCHEEARHEMALARIADALAGWKLVMDKPFADSPRGATPFDMTASLGHLVGRNDSEWHAGSVYYFLSSHSKGAYNEWITKVRHDELKHMSIFGGLYKYIMGNTYTQRLVGMIKEMLYEVGQKNTKSQYGRDIFVSEPMMLFESIYTHFAYEMALRDYFRSIPLKTMRKVFETDINLKALPATEISAEKQKLLDEAKDREEKLRKSLARWPKKQREAYERLEKFESENNNLLTLLITVQLREFKGAEEFDSQAAKQVQSDINNLTAAFLYKEYGANLNSNGLALLKQSLLETLRDYQIMNNKVVQGMGLDVKLVDAKTGFDVVRNEKLDAQRKAD